jgi:hypothetical protein
MLTINAYIALTAVGCLAFWLMALRGRRRPEPPRLEPPVMRLRKAA